MKYKFRCVECKKEREVQIPVTEYSKPGFYILCKNTLGHTTRNMERIYTPVQLKFIGNGFTGAGRTIPHMTKEERKKDLARPIRANLDI